MASADGLTATWSAVAVDAFRQPIPFKTTKAIPASAAVLPSISSNPQVGRVILYGCIIHAPIAFRPDSRIRYSPRSVTHETRDISDSSSFLRSRRNVGQHQPGPYARLLCAQSTEPPSQLHQERHHAAKRSPVRRKRSV